MLGGQRKRTGRPPRGTPAPRRPSTSPETFCCPPGPPSVGAGSHLETEPACGPPPERCLPQRQTLQDSGGQRGTHRPASSAVVLSCLVSFLPSPRCLRFFFFIPFAPPGSAQVKPFPTLPPLPLMDHQLTSCSPFFVCVFISVIFLLPPFSFRPALPLLPCNRRGAMSSPAAARHCQADSPRRPSALPSSPLSFLHSFLGALSTTWKLERSQN